MNSRITLLLGLSLATAVAQGAITAHLDREAFLRAAPGPVLNEDFDRLNNTAFATTPLLANGFSIVGRNARGNAVVLGRQLNLYTNQDDDQEFLVRASVPSYGFGGDFLTANSGEGVDLVLSFLDGRTQIVPVAVNTGFFGFTSTEAFTSFRMVSRGLIPGTTGEAFYLDDVVVAAPVPEPASLAALGLGYVGLLRRRAVGRARKRS